MTLVPLLNPKFATVLAAMWCELRVRGTRAGAVAPLPSRCPIHKIRRIDPDRRVRS
jgi:hypothetical protein